MSLPWIDIMLENIKNEYSKPHPQYSIKEVNENDMK